MTILRREDLDETEARLNARFHALECQLDELIEVQRAHGQTIATIYDLVSRLAGRRPTAAPSPIPARVALEREGL